MAKGPTCPYCNQPAVLVTGEVIYPHRKDLHRKFFWNCAPCKAYVGCHGETQKPLGRLANARLRHAKREAHRAFDPIWREEHMTRSDAYYWLAKTLGISKQQCHIGEFDEELCHKAQTLSFGKYLELTE